MKLLRLPALAALPLALLGLTLPLAAFALEDKTEVLDRIVAVVDDGVILQSELDQAITVAQGQMRERGITAPPALSLQSQVLERLIVERLQTDRAKEAGVKVDDRELNEVLNKIATQNNMTLAEFVASVKNEGVDYASLREQVRNEILVNRVRQKEVDSRVVVTDQDIDQFLAASGDTDQSEYHLQHVLVGVPDGASPEVRAKAKAKADGLLKRLRGGEDFTQLAIANSDGQQALQGGDLGWRKSSTLPTAFAGLVTKMQAGQISEVIEAANGYNIVKLVDKREAGERQTVTETQARHILLIPNTLRDEDATRAQAFELHDRLVKGDDFNTLAKKYSDDPGSKNAGGDLGWEPPGTFAEEFQKQIDELKPGEISQPFHTQFGWHIARVEGRRTRDVTDQARRARARQAIQQRKQAEEYEAWVRRLREEAYVEYRLAGESDNGDIKIEDKPLEKGKKS